MRIKFWGVRGSIPAPLRSESIGDKIKKALMGAKGVDLDDEQAVIRYINSLPLEIRGTSGGNTPCVEVNAAGQHIIFDAGSGLRELGNHLIKGPYGRGEGTGHIFISHTHWDHIQGFPFFIPAYISGNKFSLYSPKKDIKDRFIIQQIDQDMFPMALDDMGAKLEFIHINEKGVEFDGVKVDCVGLHHPGGSWAYRVRAEGVTLVYATDSEYQDLSHSALQPFFDFFSGADALIFDSMYTFSESFTKEGWGHSTSLVGVDMAVKTGVKRLILFHHEPNYDDVKLREILEKTIHYYSLVREHGQLEILLANEGDVLEI